MLIGQVSSLSSWAKTTLAGVAVQSGSSYDEAVRCYRMNLVSEDAAWVLREEGQWTAPWGPSSQDEHCEKCQGSGETEHVCWSCA